MAIYSEVPKVDLSPFGIKLFKYGYSCRMLVLVCDFELQVHMDITHQIT